MMKKNNHAFKMNGKVYESMMEIARDLGKKRVYPRDFEKLGIEEIDLDDVAAEPEEDVDEVSEAAPKKDGRLTRKLGSAEEIAEAEKIANKGTIMEFCTYVKHFSVDALESMAQKADINTWESIANVPIRRMRLFMELKAHYFPNEKTPVKPVSNWSKMSLQSLIGIAQSQNLDFKTSADEKIQRMRVTQALNSAGLDPQNFLDKEVKSA